MKRSYVKGGIFLLLAFGILLLFGAAVSNLEQGQQAQGREQLESVLHRSATACYAAEGAYPADLDSLCRRCGIQYNEEQYTVIYEPIASNLMPQITVLERKQ